MVFEGQEFMNEMGKKMVAFGSMVELVLVIYREREREKDKEKDRLALAFGNWHWHWHCLVVVVVETLRGRIEEGPAPASFALPGGAKLE